MKNFNIVSYILLALFMVVGVLVNAQAIAGWDFDPLPGGSNNFGPSPLAPTSSAANVTVGGLTRGSGVGTTGTGAGNAWGGNDYQATTAAAAATGNDFYSFTITPNAGFPVSLSSIGAYNIRRSSTGSSTGQWQYAINAGSFVNIGTPITWGSTTSSAGNAQPAITLSGISDLQAVASPNVITIRVLVYGGTASTGTAYLNDPSGTPGIDFQILGSLPLPVTWDKFEVRKGLNGVDLTWNTVSEFNNDYFQIERSSDAQNYQAIGRVEGADNSVRSNVYTFEDMYAKTGLYYYRLLQVDNDGKYTFSGVKAIKVGSDLSTHIFPNPASGFVNVSLTPSESTTIIKIVSLSGAVILQKEVANTNGLEHISLSGYPSGVYSVQIMSNGEMTSNRLVITE
jgi:hypothetical protein